MTPSRDPDVRRVDDLADVAAWIRVRGGVCTVGAVTGRLRVNTHRGQTIEARRGDYVTHFLGRWDVLTAAEYETAVAGAR